MVSDLKKSVGRQRLAAVLTFMLASAACGALAGDLLGSIIAVQHAEAQLQQYATRIMADGEASSAELRTVLAAIGASPHSSCSESEIGYLRALIFESDYLKDAGRMSNGGILCSAALGRAGLPQLLPRPDFTQQDGTEIYKNLTPYRSRGLTTITLELNDSFAVFTPLTRLHLESAPMHYVETMIDAPTQRSGLLLGDPFPARGPIFTTEGLVRQGNGLYATRCSIRFYNCITAFSTIPEVLHAHRARIGACIALGGLLGALSGLVFSLLLRRNRSIEQQLRRAVAKDKVNVVYQPIVSLATGRIYAAEALARWRDEQDTVVGPDVFIRIAEEKGFVEEITRLVVHRVLRDLGETLRSHPDFHISINVSAADLSDPEFLPMLERELNQAGVQARSLTIEITESSTVRQTAAIDTIRRLRETGHHVHIDDFGTGYSSLSYLNDLSVDAIKVDKTFTQAIGTEAVTVSILPQILAMAAALDLAVIVEGVETAQQADYFALAEQPVYFQGWLFGRPAPAEEFQRILDADGKKQVAASTPGVAAQALASASVA
jgi:sensor c-di-GMP phosphodiesterase-like protein